MDYLRDRRHQKTIGILIVLLILIVSTPIRAQLTRDDIDELERRGVDEGWTFTVSDNPATRYSRDQLCGLKEPPDWWQGTPRAPRLTRLSVPDSFDWRDYDGCTPIRNQGGCGSCWAFATVGVLECAIKIYQGEEVDLSEQWLVSCNRSGWDCDGGWWAHDYHQWRTDACGGTGAVLEDDFPYVGYDASCGCPYDHHYLIDSWAYVGPENGVASTEVMKQIIMEYGPVSVGISVNDALQAYNGGVFNACESGAIDHAVVIVGWDDNQGQNGVWIVRNSWSEYWGEDGYMRIQYGCSNVGYGACYISYRPIVISTSNTFGPAPLTVDFGATASWTLVDSCLWDFGDEDTSRELAPTHEYEQPGYYTVTLTLNTTDGQYVKTSPGLVSAYADTLILGNVVGQSGHQARVDFYVHNYIPLHQMILPFTWEGPFNLSFDSISTAGLRTEYFENQNVINYDPYNKRMVVSLRSSYDGGAPLLAPDTGAVLYAFFMIPPYARNGSNPIATTSYGSHVLEFVTTAGEYTPVQIDGSVSVSCCRGRVGNIDNDPFDGVDLSDLTRLIDYLFISFTPPVCLEEANCDGDPSGQVDLSDLTRLIDYLFITFSPLAECP